MDIAAIKQHLIQDIETLREPTYGYIKAGLPRFPALFGRDSCITSWQLIEYDASIAKKTIEILAKLQGKEVNLEREEEPGKILHEWHPKPEEYKVLPWPLPYYGSVDATPLFIILCFLYYEKTTDTKWLENIWPNMEAALLWCEKFADPDGDYLLEYRKKNPSGLEHQGWKDSRLDHLHLKPPIELIEPQGYYYLALMSAEELALALKKPDFADKLRERAKALRMTVLEEFWRPETRYFAMALDDSKKSDSRITSNPGHLLFTGILDGDKEKTDAVVKRLFAPDMWTPYGIRTHAETNPDFNPWSYHLGSIWPHDNWIIAQGLKRCGYVQEYNEVKLALMRVHNELGEIPELYTVVDGRLERIPIASAPQAWASGALLNMLLDEEVGSKK